MNLNPQELLAKHSIKLETTAPGRYYTTCPYCSPTRSKAHQPNKVLGVTIESNGSVRWGCNHCNWTGPEKGNGGAKPELVSYVYRDAGGVVRFRKVRNAPGREPRFYLQQPNGGGWKTGTKGVDTKIIYRADEIAKAIEQGQPIICAEGEKDVDNLWRLGFAATCNAHGASESGKAAKWTRRHSEQLAGADLVVLNDHDDPGIAHADAVCELSVGLVRRIRRLDLSMHWPEIPKGGDVSDWLALGHSGDELKAFIDAAPDYVAELPGTTAEAAETTDDDAELTRLAKLPSLEYERARKVAAKALGMRASMLDRVVIMKRTELGLTGDDGRQGRPIEFFTPEPWPTPIDGAALFDDVKAALGRHVVMGEHQHVAVALWCAHCYLLDRTMISPRLAIRSPVKGCGKTTCVDVLSRLVPRPLATANVSPSAIFRVIAAHRPTLLIDEADTLFRDGDETLRGVLNAGHRRGGMVLRSVGDDFEPRAFNCYAATVIALIGQLPATLADRSVDIVLARRRPNEQIEPFRLDRTEPLDLLARQLARWANDNGERISNVDPEMPPGIYNRAADNWRPLLAIAEAAGGPWPERARKAAVDLVGGDVDEVSRIELLLGDIRDIFAALDADEITSANLIERLCEIVPRPWAEFGRSGKPITQNKLARLLKPLAIHPELIGTARLAGYRLAHFAEAFDRYLSPVSNLSTSPTPYKPGTSDMFATSQAENAREVAKSKKSNNDGLLRGREVAQGDTPLCAVCGRPGGNYCARGGNGVWLHRECEAAFLQAEDTRDG